MRSRLLCGATLLLTLGCSSGPMPTLDDYARGSTAVARGLAPLFERGEAPDPSLLARPDAARALQALAARWHQAVKPGAEASLRILDLRFASKKRARMELELRLRGFSREVDGERVALVQTLALELGRENGTSPWRLESSGVAGEAAFQRGRPHLTEEAAARGLVAASEVQDPLELTNYCVPATHHRPGVLLVDVDADGDLDVVFPNVHPQLFLNDGRGMFREATAGSGLDQIPPGEPSGGVAADLDGDGLPELFLTYHAAPCRMLKNEGGGRFRDVTERWGLGALVGPYTSAMFFDADRDGLLDLFIACYGDARTIGPTYSGFNGVRDRFFHHVLKGGASGAAGIASAKSELMSAAPAGAAGIASAKSSATRSAERLASGEPYFIDATEAAGVGDVGWGFAVSACDYDDDGDDDFYLANDFGLNSLYENRSEKGHPRFVNVRKESGTEDEGYGMGLSWGDYDLDGRWDLHVTDYWTPYHWILRDRRWPMPPLPGADLVRPFMAKKMARRSRGDALFRNLDGRRFEHVSQAAGVADGGWAWGTEFVDLDGKGREDLLVVNGMYESGPGGHDDEVAFWNGMGREGVNFHDGIWGNIDFGTNGMASKTVKKLFRNRGDGTFEDRAFVEGFDTLRDTRGLAYGDLDGDGAPEVVVSVFRGPLLLYHNGWGTASGGRLRLLLSQPDGRNRDALGAVVRVTAGGRRQMREVRAGSSFLSQSSRELLFGLGEAKEATRIEVRWPDGSVQTAEHVAAGSRVRWTKGKVAEVVR